MNTKKLFLLVLMSIVFLGCDKDKDDINPPHQPPIPIEPITPVEPTDARDQYLGEWKSVGLGNLKVLYNGEDLMVFPIDETTNITISKSGSNQLIIGGNEMLLQGESLTMTPLNDIVNESGVTMNVTSTISGTILSSTSITITEIYSGVWTGFGDAGIITGKAIYTLTKK